MAKCKHGKQAYICKDCGGKGICKHGRQRYFCKDCGGKGICEHGRLKGRCKEGKCGGRWLCPHHKVKYYCQACKGQGICEHGRQKRTCREPGCDGGDICVHGTRKSLCKEGCGGGSLCEHNKPKNRCNVCDPVGYLSNLLGNRTREALKGDKKERSLWYLGCTIKEFMEHIESTFKPGMCWGNHGDLWHIDHVVPIKYENPTLEQVVQRLHWTNTQALYKTENIAKGNHFVG